MKARKIKPQGSRKHLTPAERAEMVRLRQEDPRRWTYWALADKFKCTDSTAYYTCGRGTSGPPTPRPEDAARVLATLRAMGAPLAVIDLAEGIREYLQSLWGQPESEPWGQE